MVKQELPPPQQPPNSHIIKQELYECDLCGVPWAYRCQDCRRSIKAALMEDRRINISSGEDCYA